MKSWTEIFLSVRKIDDKWELYDNKDKTYIPLPDDLAQEWIDMKKLEIIVVIAIILVVGLIKTIRHLYGIPLWVGLFVAITGLIFIKYDMKKERKFKEKIRKLNN